LSCALAAGSGCATETNNIHETSEGLSKACFDCHSSAYQLAQSPVHAGVYPVRCSQCHVTTQWVPAPFVKHPEAKFPITTGVHASQGIACADCHIAALGSNASGANTDCIHCHIGAHNAPAVDAVHAAIPNYTPASPSAPHACLGCHPSG
jgi:hypothetical protein